MRLRASHARRPLRVWCSKVASSECPPAWHRLSVGIAGVVQRGRGVDCLDMIGNMHSMAGILPFLMVFLPSGVGTGGMFL